MWSAVVINDAWMSSILDSRRPISHNFDCAIIHHAEFAQPSHEVNEVTRVAILNLV